MSTEDIYSTISNTIIRTVDGPWSEAVLEVELHSLAMKIRGGYMHAGLEEPCTLHFNKEDKKVLMNSLVQLHMQSEHDEENRWNSMNYNLSSNGQYRVEFEWNKEIEKMVERFYEEA